MLIVTVLLSVGVIVMMFCPLQKVFAFTETRVESPTLHYIPVVTDDTFRIRYTHSIHKSDVLEYYKCVEKKSYTNAWDGV